MKLSKGPINKLMGLQRLINDLEKQILTDVKWSRIIPTNKEVNNFTEQALLTEGVTLIYQLYGLDVVNSKEIWGKAFIRQAEIWLFKAELNSRVLEVTNGA